MKQKHLLIYLFLFLAVGIKAQNKVSFDYDEAGKTLMDLSAYVVRSMYYE